MSKNNKNLSSENMKLLHTNNSNRPLILTPVPVRKGNKPYFTPLQSPSFGPRKTPSSVFSGRSTPGTNQRYYSRTPTPTSVHHSAGMIFTNDRVILAGYQRKWRPNEVRFISGFGGSMENGEHPLQAAIRETIEEIYEFVQITKNNKNRIKNCNFKLTDKIKIPIDLVEIVNSAIRPSMEQESSGKGWSYTFYKYDIQDLITLMRIVYDYYNERADVLSIVYTERLPLTIDELIFNREDKCDFPEILSICILPVDNVRPDQNIIKREMKNDIRSIHIKKNRKN